MTIIVKTCIKRFTQNFHKKEKLLQISKHKYYAKKKTNINTTRSTPNSHHKEIKKKYTPNKQN